MEDLAPVAKFMVVLGVIGGVYALTYVVLIWRGHFDDDGVLPSEDASEPSERDDSTRLG